MKRAAACLGGLLAALVDGQIEIGPHNLGGGFTGRISAIACNPSDQNTYLAGGADGGVWYTQNGGASWTNTTDGMSTSSIGAIAYGNRSLVYAGTGESNYANHSRYGLGIYKSTNGGLNWTHLAESVFGGRCIAKLAVNYRAPTILFAAVTPAGGFPEKTAAKGHPGRDGDLGLWKSTDGAVTWNRVTALPNEACTDVLISSATTSVMYAAIGRPFGSTDNGIYRSTDAGTTWVKLAGGLPTVDVGRISIAEAKSNPGVLYALIAGVADSSGGGAETQGAYRSGDSGLTWTKLTPLGNIQATYGWYLNCVTVDPSNPSVAFFGGLNMSRTTNNGASFSDTTAPHVDNHAFAWDTAGRLIVGCDGGIYRTSDLGANWTSLNNGIGTTQFYAGVSAHPTNMDYVMGGLQDNGTGIRPNNTLNWTHVIGGDGGWTAIDQQNPLVLWGQPQGLANLYRSANGGASFTLSSTGISSSQPNAFYTPMVFAPGSSTTLLCGTDRVYRSTNSGASWTAISPDLTPTSGGAIRSLAVSPVNANIVWVATTDGVVARSTNGGTSFTNSLTGIPGWIRVTREIVPSPDVQNTWYLAVSQFGTAQVRRTTDNGATWLSLDGDLPDLPVNTIGIDPRTTPDTLYAGTDAGLYRSTNDGVNWTKVSGLPNVPVIDLRYRAADGSMVVATQGRGMWVVTL